MSTFLKTDEQTMSDLAVFARSGKASIYDLYNKTITQGAVLSWTVCSGIPCLMKS
ncbi:hypothetical protein [Pseudobacter ginsenosidimutans]|uniref:hypothetical protein n=1 Tax=Pseudobacter ginsenosidimutans TaxID=661488 RepID=UPI0013154BEB|nr:hypothetical protein [Pseudobacter ginsenosidimutans]